MALDGTLNELFGKVSAGLNSIMPSGQKKPLAADGAEVEDEAGPDPLGDDALLELWQRIRRESLDNRWVWERQWQRNLWYILNRQWIEYFGNQGGWREKRLAPNIPKPVTNICKDTLKAIRSTCTSINIGVNVRPNGSDPKNVSAAATADELAPFIHDSHSMNSRMSEFDFWLITCGNAFLHVFLDYDIANGGIPVDWETCVACGYEVETYKRPTAQEPCEHCGATEFAPSEKRTTVTKGKPATIALSPLEVAFPNGYARFADIPYIVRLRWRTKWYYEQHPELKALVKDLTWSKSPTDRSLQLFKSIASQNDLGVMPTYLSDGSTGNDEDGLVEYEVQMKPCDTYPEGLVFRVMGDESPKVVRLESEGLPGALPYKDADGRPLWTWTHAPYEQVGGRVLGSGPIDLIIQKQDQLNQLDSLVMMTLMRLAAGGWIIPKGAEIENMTKLSMPGTIVRWNPLTVQGNAKPERFEGAQINESWFKYREQIIADAEKLTGTFDIIKGAKPTGVEAFSALQLLVERSQSSFASMFMARGDAYKDWFKFAIELERAYGPDERTEAVLSPSRSWTFHTFKRANLNGSISVLVEDGSNAPKTSLGLRAAVQQAATLGILDVTNSDTRYAALQLFGLSRMVPTLDVHIQSALQKQEAFENWIVDPAAVQQSLVEHTAAFTKWQATEQSKVTADPEMADTTQPVAPPPSPLAFTPLKWQVWYDPSIHKQEFEKWANSDRMRELMGQNPAASQFMTAHYNEIKQAAMQAAMEAAGPQIQQISGPGGGSVALKNSNDQTAENRQPGGTGEGAQNAGPR